MTGTGATGGRPHPTGDDPGPRIEVVVPPELAIDELGRRHLVALLAASPAEVTAALAPLVPIAPGSSQVVQAEWAAMSDPWAAAQPDADPEPSGEPGLEGAVALRSGVDHTVGPRSVTVGAGSVVVDAGAHTSDPMAPTAPIRAADPQGRPPFRRRPVVLFLEGAAPLPQPEALRDLVNGLVVRHVEARLATAHPIAGPHLTGLCAPTEATWHALAPDVAVVADPEAEARAAAWCDQRGTVFIALDGALGSGIELVSWTIGKAQGRLRARIGPTADPDALAELVNRLCAGPQPQAPTDPPGSTVAAPHRRRASVGDLPTTAGEGPHALHDPDEDDDDEGDDEGDDLGVRTGPTWGVVVTEAIRAAGSSAARLDRLEAAGHEVHVLDPTGMAARTNPPAADLLIVDPTTDPEAVVAWRTSAGPAAAVVVDLTNASDPSVGGDERTTALARAAGAVLVPGAASVAGWRASGVRAQVAPALVTRTRVDVLEAAAARRVDPSAPLLGWWVTPPLVGSDQDADPAAGDSTDAEPVRHAIADALVELLAAQPDARVEVVGHPPGALARDHPQVVVRSRPPDPGQLAAWTAQIWSPDPEDHGGRGDEVVLEAGFAGVPTVSAAAVEGTDPELVVAPGADPAAWLAVLGALADDQARHRWSVRAARRAEGLRGPEASRLAVERFLSWATAGATP